MTAFASVSLFYLNDTANTEIYTLSLHDALPISVDQSSRIFVTGYTASPNFPLQGSIQSDLEAQQNAFLAELDPDRKSTRLNSSHVEISYAVFCLKKKKEL